MGTSASGTDGSRSPGHLPSAAGQQDQPAVSLLFERPDLETCSVDLVAVTVVWAFPAAVAIAAATVAATVLLVADVAGAGLRRLDGR